MIFLKINKITKKNIRKKEESELKKMTGIFYYVSKTEIEPSENNKMNKNKAKIWIV